MGRVSEARRGAWWASRRRQRFDPTQVDDARRVRELQAEVERLKRRVAELRLDQQMLQDIAAKKW